MPSWIWILYWRFIILLSFQRQVSNHMLLSHRLKIIGIIGLAVTIIFATSAYAFGLISGQHNVDTTGIVLGVNIGSYADAACTQNQTTINWGGLYPGGNATALLYIKNLGTTALTLQVQTLNWSPSGVSSYLTLTSNYLGQTLTPGQVLPITFKLSASSSIPSQITTFSFTIGIISQG